MSNVVKLSTYRKRRVITTDAQRAEIDAALQIVLDAHWKWLDAQGREGQQLSLADCDLRDLDLRSADLSGTDFSRAIVDHSDFHGVDLCDVLNLKD